jgi:hypothetical protein
LRKQCPIEVEHLDVASEGQGRELEVAVLARVLPFVVVEDALVQELLHEARGGAVERDHDNLRGGQGHRGQGQARHREGGRDEPTAGISG